MPRTSTTNTRGRNWCFTWNNPTDVQKQTKVLLEQAGDVRYACGQLEVGANGTEHIQGYIEFSRARTHGSVRRLLPGAHIEARSGTREQARNYAVKEGEYANDTTGVPGTKWEIGTFPQQRGQRNDLKAVQEFIANGGSIEEVYDKWPGIAARYPRFIDRYKTMKSVKRNWVTEFIVLKGPTGVGKTRTAWEECPNLWVKPLGGFWFDTYENHENVLIDDFDGKENGIEYRHLLQLTDRYPTMVPVKHGFVNWAPKRLYITTNVDPKQWYPCVDASPLLRRITRVVEMS